MISQGTLIVLVASKDGLVVASDSRQTLDNRVYCDEANKLLVPSRPDRFIVAVTGTRGFYPLSMMTAMNDICGYVKRTAREFDLAEVVKDFIEKNHSEIDLSNFDAKQLAQHCQDALFAFFLAHPYRSPTVSGVGFSSSVVLASYDPATSRAHVRTIEISFSQDLTKLIINDVTNVHFDLDDLAEPMICGEGDYLRQKVLPVIGLESIAESTRRQVGTFPVVNFPTVRDNSLKDAIAMATDLIESASRMTAKIPASSGIGGPIDVRIIGKQLQPTRWEKRG
jgi:hypothetical protein